MTQKLASSPGKSTVVTIEKIKKKETDLKIKESFPTKVVVRRLPPSLSSDEFLEQVSPLPEHNYYSYVAADRSLGPHAFCRAVINFKNQDDVFLFRERFDDYVFVDPKGNEYPAVVEFAPYQKIPSTARKADSRENTIEEEVEYQKFLQALENPEPAPSVSIKDTLDEVEARARERQSSLASETPLISYINKFKLEKKRTQEKLREERRQRELDRKRVKEDERKQRRDKDRKDRDEKTRKVVSSIKEPESQSSTIKDESKVSKQSTPSKLTTPFTTSTKAAFAKPAVKPDRRTKAPPTSPGANVVTVKVVPKLGASTKVPADVSKPVLEAEKLEDDPDKKLYENKPRTVSSKEQSAKGQRSESFKQTSSSTKDVVPGSEKPERTVKTNSSADRPDKRSRNFTSSNQTSKKDRYTPRTVPAGTTAAAVDKSEPASSDANVKAPSVGNHQAVADRRIAVKDTPTAEEGIADLLVTDGTPDSADLSQETQNTRKREAGPDHISSRIAGGDKESAYHGEDKQDAGSDGERSKASRPRKARPERLLYNPAARVAERKQRQQVQNPAPAQPSPSSSTERSDQS